MTTLWLPGMVTKSGHIIELLAASYDADTLHNETWTLLFIYYNSLIVSCHSVDLLAICIYAFNFLAFGELNAFSYLMSLNFLLTIS